MPVYRRKNTKDRWRVVLWTKGRPREWTVTGTRKDAEAFEARERLKAEVAEPAQPRTSPRLDAFCVSHYRAYAETHLRPRTWRVRRYKLETLVKYLGDRRLTELSTAEVERFKRSRTDEGRKPATVNHELTALQAVLSLARRLGYPCAKPMVSRLPAVGTGRVKYWTAAEVKRLLDACGRVSPDIVALVTFVANTGCRAGEALALTWPAVDLKRRMVLFEPSAEWQPKDNEPREVPIGDHLFSVLKRQANGAGHVFRNTFGGPYTVWPRKPFARALEAAGLKGGPHKLRHSYASLFLQKRPDMFLLAKILGHSETGTTSLYSHLMPDHLERARNAVDL